MATPLPYALHPIADVVTHIDQGENPWVCLNSFLHDWWCYAIEQRQDLICQSPLPTHTAEGKRWAAFCAATVEELCGRASLPSPSWVEGQAFQLEEPWFYFVHATQPAEALHSPTPEPFRRRNIVVSGSVLDNKYELHSSKPKWEVWSEEE